MTRAALAFPLAAAAIVAAAPAAAEPFVTDVVVPCGVVQAGLAFERDLSKRAPDGSWRLAPDVHVGVTPTITLGVTTSTRALSLVDTGSGWDAALGLDARLLVLRREGLAVAARLRVVSHDLDPWKPSARAGALLAWRRGPLALVADPQLQLGLRHRDRGNRDWLRVPLWLVLAGGRQLTLALRTGVEGELATFADTFQVAAAIELTAHVHPRLEAALAFGFPALLGPVNDGNERHLGLAVTARWP